MNDDERAVMSRHADYWTGVIERGVAVVFGPVLDRAGSWGSIVLAGSDEAVDAIEKPDPAVLEGLGTFRVFAMPATTVR